MHSFIRAFCGYRAAVFESTANRWERKSLLKSFGPTTPSTAAECTRRQIIDVALAQLERFSAARATVTGSRKPNCWRLRRMYRWQQRQPKSPPEYWDDVALASPTRSSGTI